MGLNGDLLICVYRGFWSKNIGNLCEIKIEKKSVVMSSVIICSFYKITCDICM